MSSNLGSTQKNCIIFFNDYINIIIGVSIKLGVLSKN